MFKDSQDTNKLIEGVGAFDKVFDFVFEKFGNSLKLI